MLINKLVDPEKIKSKQWDITSYSDSTKTYKVTLYADNHYACSCPVWIFKRKQCKHIDEVISEWQSVKDKTITEISSPRFFTRLRNL